MAKTNFIQNALLDLGSPAYRCRKCHTWKPTSEFYDGNKKCKQCVCLASDDYAKKFPERKRASARKWARKNYDPTSKKSLSYLLRKYGITSGDYNRMNEEQNGLCAICEKPPVPDRHGMRTRLHVDHDHKTGKVRRLLCNSCNLFIGYAGESIERLRRGIEYLAEFQDSSSESI